MDIGIKGAEVKSTAARVTGTAKEQYETFRTTLDNIIKVDLPTLWQGSGSDAYVNRYSELAPSFNAIATLIEDIGTGLIKNAEFYEEADEKARQANAGA